MNDTMLSRDTNEITIMLSSLIDAVKQLEREQNRYPNEPKGVHISIDISPDLTEEDYENGNYETEKEKKEISFRLVACGGNIGIEGPDNIRELTPKELWDIP